MRRTRTAGGGPAGRRAGAFTLIELLMVMAIIAIATAVTVPSMVRSIRGNRLRSAARTVVMAGKYAWSMAILNQKEVRIAFDLEAGAFDIALAEAPARGEEGLDEPGAEPAAGEAGAPAAAPAPAPDGDLAAGADEVPRTSGEGFEPIRRTLEGVRIESVDVEGLEPNARGAARAAATVSYFSNGRCTPYTVRLVDDEGDAIEVTVDPLGSAETEAR